MQIEGTSTETLSLNRDASFFDHRKSRTQGEIFLCSYNFQGEIEKKISDNLSNFKEIDGGLKITEIANKINSFLEV